MKLLHALLIILLAYLYNADPCTDKEDPTKAGDCTGLEVDKEKGYIKCCYYNKRYFVSGKLAENTTKCVHKKQVAYDDLYKEEKSLNIFSPSIVSFPFTNIYNSHPFEQLLYLLFE